MHTVMPTHVWHLPDGVRVWLHAGHSATLARGCVLGVRVSCVRGCALSALVRPERVHGGVLGVRVSCVRGCALSALLAPSRAAIRASLSYWR